MDQKTLENQIKNCKVREGSLYKRSKFLKEWRERWIVLTMNYLFTFTNKSCKQLTDVIDLKEIKSYKSYLRKDQEMIPAGFKVRSEDQQFYFCGRNCNEKWSWIVTLERLMDYKYVGSSTYNNIEFVKTRGFISQVEFENGAKIQKTSGLQNPNQRTKKSAQEAKKQVDNEVQKIMRELQNQKQQLKQKQLQFCEKEKILKEQEIELKKHESQKIKELEKKIQQAAQSPKKPQSLVKEVQKKVEQVESKSQQTQIKSASKPVTTGLGPTVSQLKNLYEQKMIQSSKETTPNLKLMIETTKTKKKKSVVDELYSLRSRTISNLFEEFHNQNPEPQALKFTLDFLVKIASDSKFGYYPHIVAQAKVHKNRKFLAETFVQLITNHQDLQNCELLAKFIEICVFQVPDFFEENYIPIIQNKLIDFFLAVDDEDKMQILLKNIFIVNISKKYPKNQIVKSKITRLVKEAKKEQVKDWARKLVDEF